MEDKDKKKILPGFTKWDFNLRWNDYEGFAWYGLLQGVLDGETIVCRASGTPLGDDGDFSFRIERNAETGEEYTQQQVDRMEIVAFKTENLASSALPKPSKHRVELQMRLGRNR